MSTIDSDNILMMILGAILILSGPYITYRTILGIKNPVEPVETIGAKAYSFFSNGLNFVIAALFLGAGILFIINNLKGNPLG